jgi:hypothetical protein
MLFRGEKIAVYCKNHTKHINALCGQNAEFLYVRKAGSAYRTTLLVCLLGLSFDPDDGDNTFPRNVGKLLPDYTWHISEVCTLNRHHDNFKSLAFIENDITNLLNKISAYCKEYCLVNSNGILNTVSFCLKYGRQTTIWHTA